MTAFHRLDPTADARFLRAGVADPLTRVPFRPTNAVVLCATCGQVSLRETWEAVGGCPNGHARPAAWSVDAALAGGDGAPSARPAPPAPPPLADDPGDRRPALALVLAVLGVAAVLAGGLWFIGGLADDGEPVDVVEDAPPTPTGPRAIVAQAGIVEAALSADDFQDPDRRYRDLYSFAADSSGRVLSFVVTSDDFYPDLWVETPTGERVEATTTGEDEGDGTREVAVRGLRDPGLYRIHVTSRRPEATGDYALEIRQEDPVRALRPGAEPFAATLGEFSQQVDGFHRDTYRFTGVEGREHTVTVRSSAFAPTVRVTGPNGEVRGESGRAGGSVTFAFTPDADGTYRLVVSSQTAEARGAYTVQLAVAEAAPEAAPPPPLPTNGAAVADTLAAGDTRAYGIQGQLGDRVRLEVRTDGFTPSLILVGPDGSRTPAEPDGDRARIRATLPSAGAYRVVVGATNGSGTYRITLEKEAAVTSEDVPRLPGQEAAPPPPPRPAPPPAGGDGGTYRPQPIGNQ